MKYFTNRKLLILLITLSMHVQANELEAPEVDTPNGKIRGYFLKATNNRMFKAFEGIPYARPPIGQYRFQLAQPVKPWKGTWVANLTVRCIQYDHLAEGDYRINGQEDCLYVNVYTPVTTRSELLDVIIHIHGGAFMFGSGYEYGPKILMENDIIYVNFNYRLGPLGFFSTGDDLVPGNNGLKDQSMALKWIKENIYYFGGNPNSITLTGLSAGGASVTYHLLSPMSVGLFHKAIAMSGSALNPWAQTEAVVEKSKRIAASVGCDFDLNEDMVDCLRHRSAIQIVSAVAQFMPFLYNPYSPFGPIVEKEGPNSFLSETPSNLLAQGKVTNDIPLILSFVKEEGLYPGAEFKAETYYLPEINKRWTELAPHILDYNYTVPLDKHATIAEKVKEYYLKGTPISDETFNELIQMIGDRLFVTTIEASAKLFANVLSSSVYLMYFTYRGYFSESVPLSRKTDDYGVSHADDLIYLMSYKWADPFHTEDDKLMKKLLINYWLSFAKNGVPQVPGVQHEPMLRSAETLNYLHIRSPKDISMEKAVTLSHKQFWDSLTFNENQVTVQIKTEL